MYGICLVLGLWLTGQCVQAQCTYTPANITVSDIASPFTNIVGGVYTPSGNVNGAPKWAGPNGRILKWNNSRWEIGVQINEETYSVHVYNTTGSITNLPCTGWVNGGGGTNYHYLDQQHNECTILCTV